MRWRANNSTRETAAIAVDADGRQASVCPRGGDFELTVGQDFSIGYLSMMPSTCGFISRRSLTFGAIAPRAAISLAAPGTV
jgi:uncharacterized linocin/CFP29 family protein